MNIFQKIQEYIPKNEQEERDKKVMLSFIKENDDYLERSNEVAHFTASAWIVNKKRDKVLMIYHNIYDSWSWTGGHADGVENLAEVALREVQEETGVKSAKLVSENILSIEILTVDGHIKKGKYVSSHLHMNVTYLIEANEQDELFVKPDENSGVRWCTLQEAVELPNEKWMVEHIYKKLLSCTAI